MLQGIQCIFFRFLKTTKRQKETRIFKKNRNELSTIFFRTHQTFGRIKNDIQYPAFP